MKVPANLSGDRLILDYLTRLTVAGTRYLPKGSRIAFVGNTRNRIEREIGPNGAADAAHVREVLASLGEPEDLVKAERARLDAERAGRQSRATGVGGAEAAQGTGPIEARRINSRWRPGARARPTRPAPGGEGAGPEDGSASRRGAAGDGKRKGRLGGLLRDRPGTQPEVPPGTQSEVPPGTQSEVPPGTQPEVPRGTQPEAPRGAGAAGPAPDGTARQAPDGAAGQAPAAAAGQAAGGTARPAAGGGCPVALRQRRPPAAGRYRRSLARRGGNPAPPRVGYPGSGRG